MTDFTRNEQLPTTLRKELQNLARDEGLTPSKLEGTTLLSLVNRAPGWTDGDVADAMCGLIAHLVSSLREEKLRLSARVTLNLENSPVRAPSAMSRQGALAELRGLHRDTVRNWWAKAATGLAQLLPAAIDQLNSDPQSWEAFKHSSPDANSVFDESPTHSFTRVENIWRLRRKVAIELLTFRTLTAHQDNLDRIQAKGWYFADQSPDACEVVPLLNCNKGKTDYIGRGITLSELVFPTPLQRGESIFFSYRVLIHSKKEMEPSVYHSATSAGVKLFTCRLQFDSEVLPRKIWHFHTIDESQAMIPPPEGSPRFLSANRVGYVQHIFNDCQHGHKYGLTWQWPEE